MNQILEEYNQEERPKRTTPAEADVLEEVIQGIREYFDKSLDKILLYRFEREQYHLLRKKWEAGSGDLANKGPLDVYGAEHLARLFGKFSINSFTYLAGFFSCLVDCSLLVCFYYLATMPELIAQTNMDAQATSRLREELAKFTLWLSKYSEKFFSNKYLTASNEYIERSRGVVNPNPGTATSRLV